MIEPRPQVEGGEYLLLFRGLQIHEAHDHVGESRNRLDAADGGDQLAGRLRQKLHGLQSPFAQIEPASFHLASSTVGSLCVSMRATKKGSRLT